MNDSGVIIFLAAGLISIIMLFAQVQLFSIAKDVKKIRELMEEKKKE